MKKFLPILLLVGCIFPEIKEVIVHDTIYVDNTCYPCIDSALLNAEKHLDSLHVEAMKEVDDYRSAAIYQVDTMRENFLNFMDSSLFKDNMIINGDTIPGAEARFDTVTGLPYLILNEN